MQIAISKPSLNLLKVQNGTMKMFYDQNITPYGGLRRILEAISPLPLCLSGGDQMMPQGIIRKSLGDASRHHQAITG